MNLKGKILFSLFSLILSIALIRPSEIKKENINYYVHENAIYDALPVHLEKTIEKRKEEPLLILSIPQINLKRPVYSLNSPYNNVQYNVELIAGSIFSEDDLQHLILAAHSGTSKISFFKNLKKLEIGDKAYIYYNQQTFTFELSSIEEETKVEYVRLKRDKTQKILTLITCLGKEKRLILNFMLIKSN